MRKRERKRETERQRETERDRQTDRQTERERNGDEESVSPLRYMETMAGTSMGFLNGIMRVLLKLVLEYTLIGG